MLNIVVEGCAHGDLDSIYDAIQNVERERNTKFDLLICCGDFQSTRNLADLACMAVPPKYLDMCSFYKYYSGEKVAPILTIFIGGNHEASNYLQEMAYGGWVSPNIYYLGYAGVININGVRIGGISGIFRDHHFEKGHFEFPPYDEKTSRSVYTIRSLEVFRLSHLTGRIDIMLSHDWPRPIWEYGNTQQLLRFKPYFREDMENGRMGSEPCWDLLKTLKPHYWYAAHMHCRFDAYVEHGEGEGTKFVALDKCLPKRRYLDFLTIGGEGDSDEAGESSERKIPDIKYDLEWLTILHITNNLLNVSENYTKLPHRPRPDDPQDNVKRFDFTPTQDEMNSVLKKFNNDLTIPKIFVQTAVAYDPLKDGKHYRNIDRQRVFAELNPQTTQFCSQLDVDDPLFLAAKFAKIDLNTSTTNFGKTQEKQPEKITPVVSRAPLASFLPKPKFSNDEEIDLEDFDTEVEAEKKSSEMLSEKLVETSEPEPVALSDPSKSEPVASSNPSKPEPVALSDPSKPEPDTASEPADTQNQDVEEPNVKKFKRRNQDIYAAQDDD